MKSVRGTDVLSPRPYLREISVKSEQILNYDCYPFNIPAIRKLARLKFHPDVTFINKLRMLFQIIQFGVFRVDNSQQFGFDSSH